MEPRKYWTNYGFIGTSSFLLYAVTAQKFEYTVIFYVNATLYLLMFIHLILLKDSLFNASKIDVIKYRAVVKDNICI